MKNTRELRLEIDTCINSVKLLTSSREVSLAFTNLQRAKMWLGQVLAMSGDTNPYPESSNPSNLTIEPQAEHTERTFSDARVGFNTDWGQTEKVKFFRSEIQLIIDEVDYIGNIVPSSTYTFRWQSTLALMEAKMWFGAELNRIRESEKVK